MFDADVDLAAERLEVNRLGQQRLGTIRQGLALSLRIAVGGYHDNRTSGRGAFALGSSRPLVPRADRARREIISHILASKSYKHGSYRRTVWLASRVAGIAEPMPMAHRVFGGKGQKLLRQFPRPIALACRFYGRSSTRLGRWQLTSRWNSSDQVRVSSFSRCR